jgi:hypothetical protein
MAANERAQLELAQIKMMPEVARALASGLAGSTITMLDGAEGWQKFLAAGASQAKGLFDLFNANNGHSLNGKVENPEPSDRELGVALGQ